MHRLNRIYVVFERQTSCIPGEAMGEVVRPLFASYDRDHVDRRIEELDKQSAPHFRYEVRELCVETAVMQVLEEQGQVIANMKAVRRSGVEGEDFG